MKEASRKESVVVWKVEVGKGRIRKRSPKGLNREVQRNHDRFSMDFVFQLTIKETRTVEILRGKQIPQCTSSSACDSSAPIVSARVRMVVRASCCSSSVSRDQAREIGHSES